MVGEHQALEPTTPGFADSRHLWPVWFNLIRECSPGTVFGEQADGAIGHGWLDLVSTDMEAEEYAFAAAVLGACGVGAPHRRYRLYFCADSMYSQRGPINEYRQDGCDRSDAGRQEAHSIAGAHGEVRELGVEIDAKFAGLEGQFGDVRDWRGPGWIDPLTARSVAEAGATRGYWGDCDWWIGRDGKCRPIGPGVQPLANGVAARVVKLRGYGDAIVSEAAKEFIASAMEVIG